MTVVDLLYTPQPNMMVPARVLTEYGLRRPIIGMLNEDQQQADEQFDWQLELHRFQPLLAVGYTLVLDASQLPVAESGEFRMTASRLPMAISRSPSKPMLVGGLTPEKSGGQIRSYPFAFIRKDVSEISIVYCEEPPSDQKIDVLNGHAQKREAFMQRVKLQSHDKVTIEATTENPSAWVPTWKPTISIISARLIPRLRSGCTGLEAHYSNMTKSQKKD